MSGYADTIRDYFAHSQPTQRRGGDPRLAPYSSLDALEAELVEQADRIAWLEGEVAGWRIKNQQLRDGAKRVLVSFETVGFEDDSEQLLALCDLRDVLAALGGTPSQLAECEGAAEVRRRCRRSA